MQKIEYIEHRLLAWGEWAIRQKDGGGPQRVVSSIYDGKERVQGASDARDPLWLQGAEIEIDGMVTRLASVDPALSTAVREVYFVGRRHSLALNARRLKISRNCLHDRVCRAHLMLDAWLREKSTAPARRLNSHEITVRA